jgi:hypothetical protein
VLTGGSLVRVPSTLTPECAPALPQMRKSS